MTDNNTESTQYGITFNDELSPVWSIADKSPRLLAELAGREPWISKSLDSINQCLVVANTCKQFRQLPYYRLLGHRRAFYIQGDASTGVISIKGSELTAFDIGEALEELAQDRATGTFYSLADYYVFREQKIPMALMFQEAIEEAEIALELHTAYYEKYGELPRIPFPLSIFKWPDKDVAHFIDNLKNKLSARAFELVQMLSESGLAVYCYYYPNTPIRVREIYGAMAAHSKHGYAARMEALRKHMDPGRVIPDWITLLARMLGLGFIPVILANDDIGQAVRAQNTVFDGGFADVGSFQRISDISDDSELQESLWVMIIELTMSVRALLVGGLEITKVEHHDMSVVPFVIGCRIRDELLRAVGREKADGISFDPRIDSILRSDSLFWDLDHDFRKLFPATRSGQE